MKIAIALVFASLATATAADLPLVEFIDPAHPSKDDMGAILNAPDGRHVAVHLRTFGSDQVERARAFGKSVKSEPDLDKALWKEAAELYPTDKFFQKAFYQFARNP